VSNVPVSITYTSPTWNANPNSGSYSNDSGVTFTNNDASNDCKLWYRVGGAAEISHTITHGGGYYTVPAVNEGISFKITDTSVTTPPALSHVIHVGSGLPGAKH
jgi:hypothetical protein